MLKRGFAWRCDAALVFLKPRRGVHRVLKASFRTVAAAGAVCLLGAAGLAGAAQSARVRPVAQPVVEAVSVPSQETDADRRARLNARLQQMIHDGKGGRLVDPVRRASPRAASRPRLRPAADQVSTAPRRDEPTGTVALPTADPFARPSANRGGRYVAPRLDLVTAPRIPDNDIECLTQAVYYEARNESEEGQAAVAQVVMNRSRHGAYPKSVCAVVYQRNSRTCQFTFTCDGSIGRGRVNPTAWRRAERIAREVYDGRSSVSLPKSSVNYHADYVRPSWGRRLERVRQIGAHIFYGAPLNGANPGANEAVSPARSGNGLIWVRNEALDRAYALAAAQTTPAPTAEGGA